MNKYNTITIRLFLFLTVVVALYLYYPFAYRMFASLMNIEWHESAGTFAAGSYFQGKEEGHTFDVLVNIFLLGSFIIGFIALPGTLLFYAWRLNEKIKTVPCQVRKSRPGGRGRKNPTITGVDEKLLLNAYNQVQHIEVTIDARLTKIKEDLVTELREEMRSMFDRKVKADQCLDKARGLYKSGNYEDALGTCNSAVALSPTGVAYFIRGVVHHRCGLDEAAMDDLQTAAKLGYQKAQDFLATKGVSY